jgi:hypothetical protein
MVLMTRLLRNPLISATWRFVFKPAARYPADPRAVFILALSVFSGVGAIVIDAAPATLEAVLPGWVVMFWGILLVFGSGLTLGAMLFQTLNGIIAEQIGSVIVGATTVFYSSVAIWVVLAWGLSCFVRWMQLQALINQSFRAQRRSEFEQAVQAEANSREVL